jgi:MFS family permease
MEGKKRSLRATYRTLEFHDTTTYDETVDGCAIVSDNSENICLAPPTVISISIDDAMELLGFGRFHYQIMLASGLCFAADGMQVVLLTFLTPILKEQWGLSNHETAGITSTLFAGSMFGTLAWGSLADRIGRRPVFLLAMAVITLASLGTSLIANDYSGIVMTTFGVGFGVGGLTIPFDMLAEFLPTQSRGKNLIMINYTWTMGVLYVIAVAYLFLRTEQSSWRVFSCWCSFPCVVSCLVGYVFVPESPRWLVSRGRLDDAMNVLRIAAATNGNDVDFIFPESMKLKPARKMRDANVLELLQPQWRNVTLRIWGAWFTFAFGYYGTLMVTTRVFSLDKDHRAGSELFDYGAIFVSTIAEFIGTTLGFVIIDRFGRIPSQVMSYLLAGSFLCAFCIMAEYDSTFTSQQQKREVLLTFAFVARIFEMAATCILWVSTAEIFSTEMRGVGHSSANALARIGAFFCPIFIENSNIPLIQVGMVMLLIHCVTAFCVAMLPETMGREMGFSYDSVLENSHHDHDSSLDPDL